LEKKMQNLQKGKIKKFGRKISNIIWCISNIYNVVIVKI
jgi:hypothetical protein